MGRIEANYASQIVSYLQEAGVLRSRIWRRPTTRPRSCRKLWRLKVDKCVLGRPVNVRELLSARDGLRTLQLGRDMSFSSTRVICRHRLCRKPDAILRKDTLVSQGRLPPSTLSGSVVRACESVGFTDAFSKASRRWIFGL